MNDLDLLGNRIDLVLDRFYNTYRLYDEKGEANEPRDPRT